jgi:hypothetical protein
MDSEPKKELEVSKDEQPVEVKKSGKTKTLDQSTVDKAAEIATQEANDLALKNVPKTSAGFEKDFNQLKKDSEKVYQYIRKIPVKTIETLYKKSEIEAHVLSGILSAISTHGLSDASSCAHAGSFLASLSRASNFDMTLMFIDDAEKKHITQIVEAARQQAEKDVVQRLDAVYGAL